MTTKDKAPETVIIENVSRRLHIIQEVRLAPTASHTFPASVLQNAGVQIAFAADELKLVDEVKAAITDEKDAEAELARRKAERAGKGTDSAADKNGAPAAKQNAGK